ARLDAEPAEDAPQIVDLVRAPVALARGVAPLLGVVRAFDVDGVGRTRPGAELAPHALLQAVGPAVELVAAVEAGSRRLLLLRVVGRDGLFEHVVEDDPEALDGVQPIS